MATPKEKGKHKENKHEESNEVRVWTCPFKDCGTCYRQKDTIKLNAMIRNHLVNRHYEEATEKVKDNLK